MEFARCNYLHITRISLKKKNDAKIGQRQQNEKRSNLIRYVTHDVLSLSDVMSFIYENNSIYQDDFRSTKTIYEYLHLLQQKVVKAKRKKMKLPLKLPPKLSLIDSEDELDDIEEVIYKQGGNSRDFASEVV